MEAKSKILIYNEVLALNQRVHTAFGDMFPHKGLLQIGGSRKFIQKAYLSHLRKIITDILSVSAKHDVSGPMAKTSTLWNEVINLLTRLELHSANLTDNDINSIAVTLYFVSGAIWNYLARQLQIAPMQDKRYLTVEPIPILLKMTSRIDNPLFMDINNAIDILIVEIPSLARP